MAYKDPEAQRAYQREWVAKRRAAWFADKTCIDCGTSESLELDHLDTRTKVTHVIWSWSASRREAELAKCVVRCHPCHVNKTVDKGEFIREGAQKRLEHPHGTHNRYLGGCRCDECKAAHALIMREWRNGR